ncbi:MAG TPA: PBP1A family penicillin-binding protein [Chthoniobacteraceae bacterium]|nr:PBP1A family penicillin-binding protein [Chthoniobacteraceae bacterium]
MRRFLKVLGWCACACAVLLLALVVAAMVFFSRYKARAAKYDLAQLRALPERSAIVDANGEIYTFLDGENRLIVPLDKVAKTFIDALLAREDARFWEHHGVDPRGIVRAAIANLRSRSVRQGASTITQQLARNAFQLRERTLDRKALEAALAQRIERQFSKEQILELYVNRIYFGSGFHGIEAAARGYFGKAAAELTLGESALLAGIIRSPNKLSPTRDLDAAIAERDVVLDRMAELRLVTREDASSARASRIAIVTKPAIRFRHDYVTDAVSRELETLLASDVLDYGGLRICTTIDPQLQRLAQDAVDRRLTELEQSKDYPHPRKRDFVPTESDETEHPTNYLQGALVAIDNRTGAIRAIVGGRDFAQSKFSRALVAKRQIGSTFKPFVYAAAFDRGLLPGTLIDDSKIAPGEFQNISQKWSPENSDDEYAGLQPASFGLLKSRNTMTVRVGEYAGLSHVRDLALAAGIGEAMPDLPVAFLGAFETTLKDLTAAYTIFPNLGMLRTPHLVTRVEDRAGKIVWEAHHDEKRVLDPTTAWLTSSVLQQVMKTGTAAKSGALGWKKPGGGKTGTTNDFYDAWFVGYTSAVTCGVWVGMDQPETILEKGYGSALALPIWVDFMQDLPGKTYPAAPFEPPNDVSQVRLCATSGLRATAGCEAAQTAYDAALPVTRLPGQACAVHPAPQPELVTAPVTNGLPPPPAVRAAPAPPASLTAAPGVRVVPPLAPALSATTTTSTPRVPAPAKTPPNTAVVVPAPSAPRGVTGPTIIEELAPVSPAPVASARDRAIGRRAAPDEAQAASPVAVRPRVRRAIPVRRAVPVTSDAQVERESSRRIEVRRAEAIDPHARTERQAARDHDNDKDDDSDDDSD